MEREQLNFYLQKTPGDDLTSIRQLIENSGSIELIQKPTSQTLLVPVKDPINEGSFLSGEVLVTSCIVRVNSTNGWAMVQDDNPELAVSIAILDGAYAADFYKEEIIELAKKGRRAAEQENSGLNARVNSTRVTFDLL